MSFQPLQKYGASGWMRGAVAKKSQDGESMSITLGQDIMQRFQLMEGDLRIRVNIGSAEDAGKIVLIPMRGGYKLSRDTHGKGRIRFKSPQAVKLFFNGHKEIKCTVLPWDGYPANGHGKPMLLCGNNRG